MESRCGSGAYGNLIANPSEGYEYSFNGVDVGVFGDPWPNIAPTRAQTTSNNLLMPDTLAASWVGVEPQFLLTALHSLPPRVFVVVIFPQRKGRIRSAERTEVHLVVTIHFTNLLSALRCGPWAYERKFVMPVRRLPSNPDLDHLKYQAKDLLKEHAAGDRGAAQRLREFHPRSHRATDAEIFAAQLKVSDTQLTIAR